jgi:hypothetical protein
MLPARRPPSTAGRLAGADDPSKLTMNPSTPVSSQPPEPASRIPRGRGYMARSLM